MKRKLITLCIAVTVLLASFGIVFWIVLERGFTARTAPSSIEAFIARGMRGLSIPRAARESANPVPSSPEVFEEAMTHFADHCASCHGNDGSGDTMLGRGLNPPAPDMKQAKTQDLTDGELYFIIENGVRFTGMPAFGDGTGHDEATWKLVHFIRRLPALNEDDLQRMADMNPKTPAKLKAAEEIQRFLRGEDPVPPAAEGSKHHH